MQGYSHFPPLPVRSHRATKMRSPTRHRSPSGCALARPHGRGCSPTVQTPVWGPPWPGQHLPTRSRRSHSPTPGGDIMSAFDPPVVPRNGHTLVVLIIARISTVHQDRRSLADQIALCERYVRDRYAGPVTFVHIQGQGSGEFLDRKELADAEAAVESGRFDLVVVEDIGRICRRNRAVDFCEMCEDADTRLIAINDSIDTSNENWRLNAFFASFKHESSNKDTSKRIRRTLINRFEQGGVLQTFPYGYAKPPGAKSDADIRIEKDADAIYEEWWSRLEEGQSYSEVADWLNSRKVPTGEWTRSKKWTGRMVARVTHNPILKGYRRRNERKCRRVNKTGRSRLVQARPEERILRHAPNLQLIDPARYDKLIAKLDAANAHCGRGRAAAKADSRAGVSRKRTVWPGQHINCGVCGRLFYWGGHGQTDHMMCAGARDYHCWNAATFDGHMAADRITRAVLAAANNLPEFDEVFRKKVEDAAGASRAGRTETLRRLERESAQVERELKNVVDALVAIGLNPTLQTRLVELEGRKAAITAERTELLGQRDDVPVLPSTKELKDRARAEVGKLAFHDPAFGRSMNELVPRVTVFPYRPLDGGAVVLRAKVEINLAPLVKPAVPMLGSLISSTVVVDLFDPPQRVAFRERVVALRSAGKTERGVAEELGLTVTAAQRAMALDRMMTAAGLTDPYQLLVAPPDGDSKFRRHRHPRYQFRPLDDSSPGS
ncbi:MAG: hypothetical protein C0467_32120 [Planctomycetaceae bacterium]|nr:hypothetical protein [Planctomycetaceae bacterium]